MVVPAGLVFKPGFADKADVIAEAVGGGSCADTVAEPCGVKVSDPPDGAAVSVAVGTAVIVCCGSGVATIGLSGPSEGGDEPRKAKTATPPKTRIPNAKNKSAGFFVFPAAVTVGAVPLTPVFVCLPKSDATMRGVAAVAGIATGAMGVAGPSDSEESGTVPDGFITEFTCQGDTETSHCATDGLGARTPNTARRPATVADALSNLAAGSKATARLNHSLNSGGNVTP